MENLLNRSIHLGRDLQTLGRFWFILETVASYGFHELVGMYFPERSGKNRSRRRKKHTAPSADDRPARLRKMLEELGPAFIKAGQILSTRPDIIGDRYAREFAGLTENVTPCAFSEIKACIEEESGRKLSDIFSEFDETAMAAASIGQVHRAVLKENGTQVVVKVQRPGVEKAILQDLEIMKFIASRIEEYGGAAAKTDPVRIVEEFSHALKRELDYMIEAANLSRFAADCVSTPGIRVPEVFFSCTSRRVLVMEFITGTSAAKILKSPEQRGRYDLAAIAENGVNSLLHQIFETGFFHADPHPGNIILQDDGTICFIDCGMMGRLNDAGRRIFLKTLDCMLKNDISGMIDSALKMTLSSQFSGSRASLERDAADLVDANINLPLEKLSLARILNDLMQVMKDHDLVLQPDLYMVFKSLITIEQLGREFHPGLRIVDMVRPFLVRMKFRELAPGRFLRRFMSDLGENIELIQNAPSVLCGILDKVNTGELSFRVEHHRLNDIEETLYVTGERLSRSLLLTALFLGSALIIVAKIPPVWNGVPLPGMCGFLITGILSVYALWTDRRQRLRFLKERTMRRLREEQQRRKY